MANTLTNVVPQILAQGIPVLRENSVMPRLVNRSLDTEAREFGDTIDIPVAQDATAVTVVPGPVYTNVSVGVDKVQLSLNFWRMSSFQLSDKEIEEAMAGMLPLRASAALKALVNAVDSLLLALYKDISNTGGVAGTTPFASTATAYYDARTAMNKSLAPIDDRRVVLDADAEGNALGLPQFYRANERGDQGGIISGEIGFKIGADWHLDQQVTVHQAGTIAILATLVFATAAVTGASEVVLRVTSGSGQINVGDVFTFGGGSDQYVATADATVTGTLVTMAISPNLVTAVAVTIVATAVATHIPNLLFHRDAFAWASRPMAKSQMGGLGSIFESFADPISGIALRLEVSRGFKQTQWVWDVLGGAKTIRPELAARILG